MNRSEVVAGGKVMGSGKILYVIHIDWASPTKGRPQLLAQGLRNRVPIRVLYRRNFRRGAIREVLGVDCSAILALPLERFSLMRGLNRSLFLVHLFFELCCGRPQILWITHPRFTPPRAWLRWFSLRLVYDCMDDLMEFGEASKQAARKEPELLSRADIVFASAAYLADRLVERGASPARTKVIRNGLRAHWQEASPTTTLRESGSNRVALYFGTIDSWFDFPAVLLALDQILDLEVHLLGPSFVPIPEHPRLKAFGAVPHSDLQKRVRGADVLVMPFLLTGLIRSVDPVKLYEYVALGLPILARGYSEIEQFRPFARFYDSPGSFASGLMDLLSEAQGDEHPDLRRAFLAASTWDRRAEEALDYLGALGKGNA